MLLDTVPLAPKLYKANNCSFLRTVIATHPEVDEVVSRLCKQPEGLGPVVAWDIANPMASCVARCAATRIAKYISRGENANTRDRGR